MGMDLPRAPVLRVRSGGAVTVLSRCRFRIALLVPVQFLYLLLLSLAYLTLSRFYPYRCLWPATSPTSVVACAALSPLHSRPSRSHPCIRHAPERSQDRFHSRLHNALMLWHLDAQQGQVAPPLGLVDS
eukprot:2620513-Rhodomonas_salina.1